MKSERGGKCPRFVHIFGSSMFGGCTAILTAKKYRSRRKADLNTKDHQELNNTGSNINNAASNNTGCFSNLSANSSHEMGNCPSSSSVNNANKKTGLVNFSKVGSAKPERRKTTQSDLCIAESLDNEMLDKMCLLPPGMNRNEWLATHALALFDHVNALCGTVSDVCTPVTCTVMSYPGMNKTSWIDERGKRHYYSAMRYIDSVMSFCEASRKNQNLFPTKYGATFGPEFEAHCRRMIRLLWHCCGHLYQKHWEYLANVNLRPQFGLVLAHMAKVAKLYSLLDTKELIIVQNTLQVARPALTIVVAEQPSSHNNKSKQQQSPCEKTIAARMAADENYGGVALSARKPSGGSAVVWPNNADGQSAHSIGHGGFKSFSTGDGGGEVIRFLPSMKSGSWSGNNAAVAVAVANNFNKCYAQTC